MSNRTTDFVRDTFTMLDHLSSIQNGATIGQINKALPWASRGQVERLLNCLEEMGFAYHEVKPHGRTGKKIYAITETAAIHCASIARQYSEMGR